MKAVEEFKTRLVDASATVREVFGPESLKEVVTELLAGAARVFSPRLTELEKAAVSAIDSLEEDYSNADVTLEEVEWGVAETGTIVVTGAGGRAVQASLLPPRHVAIVRRERVLETLDELFAKLGEDLPANVTFITGPSRTADIELTLTVGVHGPESLDVIIYEEEGKRSEGG